MSASTRPILPRVPPDRARAGLPWRGATARVTAWYSAAVVLVVFDTFATAAVVAGPADEANPALAALMRAVGVQNALTVRTVLGLALLTLLATLGRRFRPAVEALIVTVLVYGVVATWHLLGPLAW